MIGVGALGFSVVGLLIAIGVYARRIDAALPEVLRADSTTIRLPREGATFPRASLVLLEVVSFNTVTSSPWYRDATGHRHLIACVRDDSGLVPFVVSRHAQAFERLAPGLAAELGVPLCRRRLGDYEVDFTGGLVRVRD